MYTAWKLLSAIGFGLLVGAYLLNQRGVLGPQSRRYLMMNACGAALLAGYSWWIREWIFVALEGFWSLASLWALGQGPSTFKSGGTDVDA